jgi:hypothetical protein
MGKDKYTSDSLDESHSSSEWDITITDKDKSSNTVVD